MHFKIADIHRTFFKQNGFIEFESALSTEEIDSLATLTHQTLQKKAPKALDLCSAQELYQIGHDLWRTDSLLRKKILSHTLAEIAGQLFDKKTLLIAFDQLLCTTIAPNFPAQIPASLQEISAIQPLAGAALLHLSGAPNPSPFIPSVPQNVLFFSPDLIIPWETFFQLPHQSYLLIAYALPDSLYVHEKRDLHLHNLKKLGYGYGDRLRHEHHPIVYRGS
jgi:hypothetical protein